MNTLTVDTYPEVKEKIFLLVKENKDDQEKLINILFQKAINEKSYVELYAKLCTDLDKIFPQKIEKIDIVNSKKINYSYFKSKLIEKCKNIFTDDIDNIAKMFELKNYSQSELESFIKNFVLGSKI